MITHPEQARTLLIAHPQYGYALLYALLHNKIVDTAVFQQMLGTTIYVSGGPPSSVPLPSMHPLLPPSVPPYGMPTEEYHPGTMSSYFYGSPSSIPQIPPQVPQLISVASQTEITETQKRVCRLFQFVVYEAECLTDVNSSTEFDTGANPCSAIPRTSSSATTGECILDSWIAG